MKEPKLAVMVRGIARKFYLSRHPGRADWHINFVPPKEARLRGAPARVIRSTGIAAGANGAILAAAKQKAAEIIQSYWSEEPGIAAEKLKLRSSYPTIGELLEAYNPSPDEVRADTRYKNKSSLRRLVKDVMGTERIEQLRVDILTKEFADKFLALRVHLARQAEGADSVTIERAKITANSTFTQAASVLGLKACARHYQDFRLPDFKGFCKARKHGIRRDHTQYRRVSASVIAAIDQDAERIKHEQPCVYRAYVLMRYLGLRPSEVWPARWNWIDREGGQDVFRICLRPDFVPKAGGRDVPITPSVLRLLNELRGTDMPNAWIIPLPIMTQRQHVLRYELNRWLRRFMPRCDSEKCAYNLRKHCGSEINDRHGIAVAAAFLGDTIGITERHYVAKARIPAGLELAAGLGA